MNEFKKRNTIGIERAREDILINLKWTRNNFKNVYR